MSNKRPFLTEQNAAGLGVGGGGGGGVSLPEMFDYRFDTAPLNGGPATFFVPLSTVGRNVNPGDVFQMHMVHIRTRLANAHIRVEFFADSALNHKLYQLDSIDDNGNGISSITDVATWTTIALDSSGNPVQLESNGSSTLPYGLTARITNLGGQTVQMTLKFLATNLSDKASPTLF